MWMGMYSEGALIMCVDGVHCAGEAHRAVPMSTLRLVMVWVCVCVCWESARACVGTERAAAERAGQEVRRE